MKEHTEHSTDYQLGYVLSTVDAEREGVIDELEIGILARIAHYYASMSLRIEQEEFIFGYIQGYHDYLNGLV